MAKTLAQGRKPGSGRKPGKAKTLKEGRKPGSGRRKRKDSNFIPVMPIPISTNFNNQNTHNQNNNNNNNINAHLFQSQLNIIPINIQPLNLPSGQNIMIPSYNHTTNINNINHMNSMNMSVMNENVHPNNINTRDMVAVDALRELTHSPLSLTPMTNISSSNKITTSKSMDDNISNLNNTTTSQVIENLTLPPLNQVFNNGSETNTTDSRKDKLPQPHSLLSHRNNEASSNIEINPNGSSLPHFQTTESTLVSIETDLNINNNSNSHLQHQQPSQQHNNNLPHNNIL